MVFVKHQVQEISGTEYEYYYLYESYYNPSMNNPTNFKVGKVGEDVSSLVSSLKEKAESNGIDLSESDLDHFRIQIRTVEEKAEQKDIDDEDKGEFYQDVFNEDDQEEENIDPDGLDNWILETSSYGDKPGSWVWHNNGIYISFSEPNEALYIQYGSDSRSKKIGEYEDWKEVVEWLQNNSPDDLSKDNSDKDPQEFEYVYFSSKRPVPNSFINEIPPSLEGEISVEGKHVGSTKPLPYKYFKDYELRLDEKNIDDSLNMEELIDGSYITEEVLVEEFEDGNNAEIKEAIGDVLVNKRIDNQYLIDPVFESVKEDIKESEMYGSDREGFKVYLTGTDGFKNENLGLRKNGVYAEKSMDDAFTSASLGRSELEKTVVDRDMRSVRDYVPLDPGENMEIGEVYVKGDEIVGKDIDMEMLESHVPEVGDMEVHQVTENMTVKGSDKALKREFAENVLNIVARNDLGTDVAGRRVWTHLEVHSGDRDQYASVQIISNNVVRMNLNVKKYKNAPEKKKREIEMHEAVHFFNTGHRSKFYNQLIDVIGSEKGSLDGYRRFLATDMRASNSDLEPEKLIPGFSEEVFDWEIKKFADKYSGAMNVIQNKSDNERFDRFTGNMAWEEVGSNVSLKIGQGRGKKRLEIAEIDRITGKISVKEPEYWVYVSKVDMTDGTVEYEDLSLKFSDALDDIKYGYQNSLDARNYARYSGDTFDVDPLVKKVKSSLASYYSDIDMSRDFRMKADGVYQENDGTQEKVLSVKEGDIIVEKGIDHTEKIPVFTGYSDGEYDTKFISERMGIKKFINMLEEGKKIYERGQEQDSQWSEYSSSKPPGIDVIGIRDSEKDKYYSMLNSVKARVPDKRFNQLDEIKFTSDIDIGRYRGNVLGSYLRGTIKIDKDKPTLTQYYVIAHEIGHLVEDDTDNPGSERLMKKIYLKSGTSYVLMPEDREVLDNFRENIKEAYLQDLPQHGQNELTWLNGKSFGKRKQSQDNYNYKEVFARSFAVWIVNEDKFRDKFPDMADYLDDFVENRKSWEEEYGEYDGN